MRRRSFVVGLGGLTLGGAGIFGSGAFSSANVSRGVKVSIENDWDARLEVGVNHTLPEETSVYSSYDADGKVFLRFVDEPMQNSNDPAGAGLNVDSVFTFDEVIKLTNQGTRPIYVWASFDGLDAVADMWMYEGHDSDARLANGRNVLKLDVGEGPARIGFGIDTTGADSAVTDDLDMTLHGTAEQPSGTSVIEL